MNEVWPIVLVFFGKQRPFAPDNGNAVAVAYDNTAIGELCFL